MGYIFNIGDRVEIICEDSFVGMQGIIKDVLVNGRNDTVYGVDMFEGGLIYFLAMDLKEAK